MHKLFLSFLLIFTTHLLHATDSTAYMVWDQFTEEDLKMTTYEADTNAEAVVLGEIVTADLKFVGNEWQYYYTHHVRVKILKKSGEEYADFSLPYFQSYNFSHLRSLEAQTVNYEGGKAVRQPVDDIFDEDYNAPWRLKKFSFPNVKPGSILEYKYTVTDRNAFLIKEHYFQRTDLPVRHSEFNITFIEFYEFAHFIQGVDSITPSITKVKVYENSTVESNEQQLDWIAQNLGSMPGRNKSLHGKRYTWVMKDLPALKEEAYVSTMSNYLIGIRFFLTQVSNYYDSKRYDSWKTIKEEVYKLRSFTDSYQKSSKYKRALKPIKSILRNRDLSQEQRIEQIYSWVTQNIKWNEQYSVFNGQYPNDTYATRTGSSADINVLLLAMLRAANIQVYAALASTRENGFIQKEHPSIHQFNNLILQANINGKRLWLDATKPYRPKGILSSNLLNGEAWVLRGENGTWQKLTVTSSKKETALVGTLEADGSLKGTLNTSYHNYIGISRRSFLSNAGEEKYVQRRLKDDFGNISIESTSFKDKEEINAPLNEEIVFSLPDYAEGGGDLLYFNPMLQEGFQENMFKMEERSYPVDLVFPFEESYTMTLTLPEGYKLEELPKEVNMKLLEDAGYFKFHGKALEDGKVELKTVFSIQRTLFEPEEYKAVRSFFDTMVEKHTAMMVLKKE